MLDMPFWVRGVDGRLKWVNRAYARAVEAESAPIAVRDGKEFLGSQAREQITEQQAKAPVFKQTVSTVVDGDRRLFAVTDVACPEGSAGIATDRSAAEAIREEFERTLRSHADTLDQLTTAVATFDAEGRLGFYNQAFQKLWDLDAPFLSSDPRQCRAARSPAHRRQARGAAGMAALEGQYSGRLSLGRAAGALVASARRPHHQRHRQSAAARAASPGCSRI